MLFDFATSEISDLVLHNYWTVFCSCRLKSPLSPCSDKTSICIRFTSWTCLAAAADKMKQKKPQHGKLLWMLKTPLSCNKQRLITIGDKYDRVKQAYEINMNVARRQQLFHVLTYIYSYIFPPLSLLKCIITLPEWTNSLSVSSRKARFRYSVVNVLDSRWFAFWQIFTIHPIHFSLIFIIYPFLSTSFSYIMYIWVFSCYVTLHSLYCVFFIS